MTNFEVDLGVCIVNAMAKRFLGKGYLEVQGSKGTYRSKVGIGYLNIKCWQRVHIDQSLEKGT